MRTYSAESYVLGNVPGNIFVFWFLTAIAIIIGFCIYGLCTYPHTRRSPFRVLGSSRLWGLILGGGVALLVTTVIYMHTWMEFYRVDFKKDGLRLCYYYPERVRSIPFDRIDALKKGVTLDKFDDRQLIICTKEGKKYRSANVSADVMHALMMKIKKRLY